MNRFAILAASALVLSQVSLSAQQPAELPPAPAAGAAPLTPPADNAPAVAPEAPAPAPITTVKATTSANSPQDVARIQQQEIIRRQELMFRANQSLAAAQKDELALKFALSRQGYVFAAEAFGSVSRSTANYARSAEGLTRVDFQLYDEALKTGDTARAKQLMEEVIKYNPRNVAANEKLAAINRALANPNDVTLLGNPAVTPGLVKRVTEVQQLFDEAEQFRRTGQWDQAEARLKRILGIDAYNIAATQQLARIDREKLDYSEAARTQNRTQRLLEVEEKWYPPIVNKDTTTGVGPSEPVLVRSTSFGIDQRLRSITLSLDFNNATIEGATNFLSSESKRIDPDHKGVNFIIQPEASSSAKPINLTLNNVPLEEALRYVCQLANVKYKVQDYAISIIPFNGNTEDLISRTFNVQPSFVAPPSALSTGSAATGAFGGARPLPAAPGAADPAAAAAANDPVRAAMEAKGVKFPPGASAVFTPNTGELKVINTADQMELIEELVNAGQAPTVMVRIAAKFVEINQTDLNDLTINSAFNFFFPVNKIPGMGNAETPSFVTQLPGSRAFSPNSIDQLITPTVPNFNTIFVRSFINESQLNVLIQALSQKKSFDLLSDPFVLTKSGEQGVIEAVRVFPYPIAFDPPQLVTQTNNTNSTTFTAIVTPPIVIATTPTDFKKRNVGVRLVVKPQVTADNRTVDLSLFPEVTDFQGFINYGSPINVANPDGTSSLLSTNDINQPVFSTRRINTKVLIKDGSTVVLGGLIREDAQSIDDRVPILADIPLIGRLFQSKAVENTKRNLIIFVTANIYRNDGELLNPPDEINAADVLTSGSGVSYTPPAPTP